MKNTVWLLAVLIFLVSYQCKKEKAPESLNLENVEKIASDSLKTYEVVELNTDISHLTEKERAMLLLSIKASEIMDEIFWMEAYGDKKELLAKAPARYKDYIKINYGTWDRLNDMKPFINGFGEIPPGANFYPKDMTAAEFDSAKLPEGKSLYTMVRRDETGKLYTIPYHEYFSAQITKAADLLRRAASYAENPEMKKYLEERAKALETDEYYASDIAWMDMKTNRLDFVVGPIETYEDQLFGYKAAHEAY